MGKPVVITLTVNGSDIYNANPQPVGGIQTDPYCSLADNNNGRIPPGETTINDFTSQVYANNTVTWVGANTGTGGYRILITGITNNPAFFDVEPRGNGNSGQLVADLKGDINEVNDTYTISFSVDPPGNGTPKPYTLDPKMQGNN